MNTEHIKTFLAVYRAESFVAVAKERNVAPSSITRAVATLEDTLQARLFQRSTRSIMPTEAGDTYYARMAPIMDAFDETHEYMSRRTGGPSGRLRVSASVSYGQIVIAPKLTAFRNLYPNIQLELILSDLRVDIISEQIDIAIRHGRLPDSALTARKLTDVSYCLVASPEYLASHDTIAKPEDLSDHDLSTFTYDDFRFEWVFKKGEVTQTIPIEPAFTITNAAAIRQSVRDGIGVALLADWTVADDLRKGNLIKVLPDWHVSGVTQDPNIWLVYPSNRFVPAKTKVFADFMLDV